MTIFGDFSAIFKKLPQAQFFESRGHFSQFAHSIPLFYAEKTFGCKKFGENGKLVIFVKSPFWGIPH